jgi:hypothetical protein
VTAEFENITRTRTVESTIAEAGATLVMIASTGLHWGVTGQQGRAKCVGR